MTYKMSYATFRVLEDLRDRDEEWMDVAYDHVDFADGNKEEAIGTLSDAIYESYDIPKQDPFWVDLLIDALDNVDWEYIAGRYVFRIQNDWFQENGGNA